MKNSWKNLKRLSDFGKPVTLEGIIANLTNKGDNKSFLDFMTQYIKRPPEKLEPNTVKKYATTLTHLKKFKKQIFFTGIDSTYSGILVGTCNPNWNWVERPPKNTSKHLKK